MTNRWIDRAMKWVNRMKLILTEWVNQLVTSSTNYLRFTYNAAKLFTSLWSAQKKQVMTDESNHTLKLATRHTMGLRVIAK